MLTAPRAQNTFLKRNLAFRYLEYVSTVENNQRYATKKICYQGHICFFDLKMFMSQCAEFHVHVFSLMQMLEVACEIETTSKKLFKFLF